MAFGPYRREAAKWLQFTVAKSREDLALPALKWYVSQQPPPTENGLDAVDVTAELAALAAADPAFIHVKAFDLVPHQEKLVITTAGIVRLGELSTRSYLKHRCYFANMYNAREQVNRLNQKGIRPQDQPIPFAKLTEEERALIRSHYPELIKLQ